MGSIRLLLALAVVASHVKGDALLAGLLDGGDAVKLFFCISGFYMAMVLTEKYRKTTLFYANRFLRLYPAYLVVLLATIGWYGLTWAVTRHRPPPFWITDAISSMNWAERVCFAASNWTLIGIDIPSLLHFIPGSGFQFFYGGTESEGALWFGWAPWVPQAWSLGSEVWFYALAPFLVTRSPSLIFVLAVGSVASYVALIEAHPLIYFFFPANLGFFLAGALLFRLYHSQLFKPAPRLVLILLWVACMALLAFDGYMPRGLAIAALAAVAMTLPWLFEGSRHLSWDNFIGNLSYPVYLSHLLVIAVLQATLKVTSLLLILVATLGVSVAIFLFVERPVEEIRRIRFSRQERSPFGGLSTSSMQA